MSSAAEFDNLPVGSNVRVKVGPYRFVAGVIALRNDEVLAALAAPFVAALTPMCTQDGTYDIVCEDGEDMENVFPSDVLVPDEEVAALKARALKPKPKQVSGNAAAGPVPWTCGACTSTAAS